MGASRTTPLVVLCLLSEVYVYCLMSTDQLRSIYLLGMRLLTIQFQTHNRYPNAIDRPFEGLIPQSCLTEGPKIDLRLVIWFMVPEAIEKGFRETFLQ
uniref:Secreted protein n=1 Tax=Steinernema glaseri TaxID=37863 RepID=A0A1I7Z2F8_9BILA